MSTTATPYGSKPIGTVVGSPYQEKLLITKSKMRMAQAYSMAIL
jgi:hypothetical protein